MRVKDFCSPRPIQRAVTIVVKAFELTGRLLRRTFCMTLSIEDGGNGVIWQTTNPIGIFVRTSRLRDAGRVDFGAWHFRRVCHRNVQLATCWLCLVSQIYQRLCVLCTRDRRHNLRASFASLFYVLKTKRLGHKS